MYLQWMGIGGMLLISAVSALSLTIHNHSPQIMSMQNLNKIHQKLFKLESGNQALTGGQADGQTFGGENIISHHYRVMGYKKLVD